MNDGYATYQDSTGDGIYDTYKFSDLSGKTEHDLPSSKVAHVRGKEHTVAKLKTDDGKNLTVDLGIAAPENKYKEGGRLNVKGVPVKLGGRIILIADTTTL